jgi:tRNA-modifying protein YgfZ
MTDNWQSFLSAQGAQWDREGVRGFSDNGPAQAGSTQLIALDHLGFLVVKGPEAKKFLQGQVTCDMNQVTNGQSLLGAHCNTKGRMIFSFRAVQLPPETPNADSIALIMQRGLLERARQSLAKFIVFSKARLSLGDAHGLVSLAGSQAPQLLHELLPHTPTVGQNTVQTGDSVCIRVGEDRFLCLLNHDSARQYWQSWAPHCQRQGYFYWNLANIRDGIGEVVPGCEELFIPQMLNMQLTGGISFTKGCYIGQEVVARMQYLGKLKRHMRRAQVTLAETPRPGSPLYAGESSQSVGNIVLAAPADADTVELLAVTTDSAFESDDLYLDPAKTQKLLPLPLPYAVPQ